VRERVETVCRQTGLSVRRACEVLEVNRSTLYRKPAGGRPTGAQAARDAAVVPVLQELAGRFPTYGYRRLKVLVSRELGRPVNGKRIRRLMHEHGLVTAQRVARARPRPHPRPVEATAPNQVWQMDFTKLVVGRTWAWLLVVLDRFSREVVGWTLSLRARATEARGALEAAIGERFPEGVRGRGLKVASDNGSAFLSDHFQAFARELEVELLRTRVRYPEGNGRCERVIRTIKEEEIWLNEYATLEEARSRLAAFLEFYNAERIHSALGYLSPRQYVALWRAGRLSKEAA
jgi:transposase InsO family protein